MALSSVQLSQNKKVPATFSGDAVFRRQPYDRRARSAAGTLSGRNSAGDGVMIHKRVIFGNDQRRLSDLAGAAAWRAALTIVVNGIGEPMNFMVIRSSNSRMRRTFFN